MVTGIVVDGSSWELLAAGERVGSRRVLSETDETFLADVGVRYVRAVQAGAADEVFLGLGRQLWSWLDGDGAGLSRLLELVPGQVTFEVRGPRSPSGRVWALLRAPLELLARPGGGFLAADAVVRFVVVRRLGAPSAVAAGADGFRLGLAFMASSPRGQHELDFEAEEAAILSAVDDARVDLLVEDTGNPGQLGRRLADVGGLPVLHLSCHGVNNWRQRPDEPGVPVLMMEDEFGDGLPTTAADLVRLLPVLPRLLFVSACLTATPANTEGLLPAGEGRRATAGEPGVMVAHSMATSLVAAGVPAVLGWDGSVDDRAATVFARQLYAQLGNRVNLASAVGDARRSLLEHEDSRVRSDWHLARLWLGPAGGGPVVGGTRRRSRVSAVAGTKAFLDGKKHVPVAAPQMFVGRRPELQRALRALGSGDRAGVLLHGQGRLGKSSLAARIADRRPDLALAVVFGDYTAAAIVDAIADAVRTDPAARELVDSRREAVRDRPESLETLLIDLLSGPCASSEAGRRPLLLVIDDLEQVLVANPNGPHRVDPVVAPVLAAVLRAFDPAETDSRLLVTSRYQFTLDSLPDRLEQIALRPLSQVAQRKLLSRQRALVSSQRRAERDGLAGRAVAVSRGNPGLQDLIGSRLVYGEQVDLARAESAVAGMESYLQQGDLPSETEIRAFLERLALDELLDQAGPPHRALLRDLTLFDLPLPEPVVAVLADRSGGSPARLIGLGLLDVYPDGFDSQRRAVAANALAAGRITPLTDDETATLAAVTVGPLFAAWGGTELGDRRSYDMDLQLTRLALHAGDPDVTAACAADAVHALRSGPAVDAFRLGRAAVDLLDRHHRPVPVFLLRRVAAAARTSGDGDAAHELFTRAVNQAHAHAELADPLDQARAIAEHARNLIDRGEPDQAEQLLHQAHQLFANGGSEREAAVCQGTLADILYQRGDYDEALRIRREIQLPVYERLADTRETAITWGNIADILYHRGDNDEALRIRREIELPVYERLGDTRSTAITWGNIADILYQRGDYDETLRIRREIQLPVYERLGDTRSTAITWGNIADILYQRGDYDETLRIRREIQLPVYERLGDTRSTAITWGNIADILYRRGDYDEALRIRRDVELPVYERLGDTRSTAATWGDIADILYRRGDYDETLRIRREIQLPVYERLGDTRSAAITWGDIADIMFQRGDYDEALRIRREIELPVYERLGDSRSTAITWGDIADILNRRGDYDEALRIRREIQLPVYERLGDIRSAAITWGKIADIMFQRGDYDEALRIRREIELPVYERLGDARETALAWGKIADILYQRGDYDEAAELQLERLRVDEALGNLDGIASSKWGLAQIALARNDYDAAFPLLADSFRLLQQLQRPDGIATVGNILGQILLAAKQPEQAVLVLRISRTAADKIGATAFSAYLGELIEKATE
ncbi:tetratricopeptide repeat protein [Actinoplanes subglobosus]|uniref:Tetratricopeptide repeat protein n=1 Tax=Actinoplanes subglobosus TaxID=1547892 RepID=A0ABV8ILX6_9ACTN